MATARPKLLSYSSRPAILAHMDPNLRILFSRRCPDIRNSDSSVPLRIKTLTLSPLEIKLNDTLYEVDFIRKNHVTNTTKLMPNDVERFRFPGANHLRFSHFFQTQFEQERIALNTLQTLEAELLPFFNGEGFSRTEEFLRNQIENLRENLMNIRDALGLIRPLEHTDYLFFSRGGIVLEYLEHTQPAYKAMEHVIQKLFEGRGEVHVDCLTNGIQNVALGKIGRKMEGMTVPSMSQVLLNALPGNFELKVNLLSLESTLLRVRDPIPPYAQQVIIHGDHLHTDMMQLVHKKVHYPRNIVQFVEVMGFFGTDDVREIGTLWTCDYERHHDNLVINSFEGFADQMRDRMPNAKFVIQDNPETRNTKFPKRIIQKVSRTSEVHMYCKRKADWNGLTQWMMVIEVLPRSLVK